MLGFGGRASAGTKAGSETKPRRPRPGLEQRAYPALLGLTGLRRHVWALEELDGGVCELGRLGAGSLGLYLRLCILPRADPQPCFSQNSATVEVRSAHLEKNASQHSCWLKAGRGAWWGPGAISDSHRCSSWGPI